MSAIVKSEGLTKRFGEGAERHTAVDGVNLTVHSGEFVSIVGRSGSGKSTLLHCLSGLLAPDRGEITVAGNRLSGASRSKVARIRRDHVGFVFQDLNLISSLSVADNVILPARLAGLRPTRRDVEGVLAAVGLDGLRRRFPDELSGGQRQRVAVARALLRRPEVLFADEPTGALDTASAAVVMELMRHTVTPRSSLVMVTHDLDLAATADRVAVLEDGNLSAVLVRPTAAELFEVLHRGGGD